MSCHNFFFLQCKLQCNLHITYTVSYPSILPSTGNGHKWERGRGGKFPTPNRRESKAGGPGGNGIRGPMRKIGRMGSVGQQGVGNLLQNLQNLFKQTLRVLCQYINL